MPNLKYPIVDGRKQCGNCKRWRKLRHYIPARNHFQVMCRDCKKEWAKEYRQRPEVKERTQAYHRALWNKPDWKEKRLAYDYAWKKSPKGKKTRNRTRRKWTEKEKQKAVAYKGGKCRVCGYDRCLAAMDFHHVDPKTKKGLKAHWSFEKNKPELDKCVLVCVRCHREIHAGEIPCPSVY